jgi:hypothetical protein
MRNHRQPDCLFIEVLCHRRATNAAAILKSQVAGLRSQVSVSRLKSQVSRRFACSRPTLSVAASRNEDFDFLVGGHYVCLQVPEVFRLEVYILLVSNHLAIEAAAWSMLGNSFARRI